VPTALDRPLLLRRGLRLEYATLLWNVGEVSFVAYAAVMARSVALAGFSLDSCIEIFASLVVVSRLKGVADPERERRAERLIGGAFFALAVYLAAQSLLTVALDVRPDSSRLGIVLLSATVVAMFSLAYAKLQTGRALEHPVLCAEAKVTMVDGALAAAILVGLLLNALYGWWWADIAGGVVVIVYGLREGLEAIRSSRVAPV
jgi:divalent metal cation (Fe/Co/Zn/Cd) transporter